jgi:hypothetical protein
MITSAFSWAWRGGGQRRNSVSTTYPHHPAPPERAPAATAGAARGLLTGRPGLPPQQLRQLGDIGCDPDWPETLGEEFAVLDGLFFRLSRLARRPLD